MAYFISIGLRANVSTNFCLAQLTDFILREMDKGLHTGMILVYLEKAFHALDHTVLLQKIECISFKATVIK